MPSDISHANSCEDVFFMYNVYIFALAQAADRNVNNLYICKSEQREICSIIPENRSKKKKIQGGF